MRWNPVYALGPKNEVGPTISLLTMNGGGDSKSPPSISIYFYYITSNLLVNKKHINPTLSH